MECGIEVDRCSRSSGPVSPAGIVVVLEVCGVSDDDFLHEGHFSREISSGFGANG